jgi:para-aminobenzoate synthetase component 2
VLPDELAVTARTRSTRGELVMAVAHRSAPLVGVQFHPESILTPQGGVLLQRTMSWAETAQERDRRR